jgi:chromosome segregation ATPase
MDENSLKINQETMDVLVANVIPTTKYFESQFNHMQYQVNELKDNQKKFEARMDERFEQVNVRFEQIDKRFEQVNKRFEQIDKKFEQIDKRFEQVDKRFEQIDKKFEQINKRFEQVDNEIREVKIQITNLSNNIEKSFAKMEITIRDNIIDRDRYYDGKFNNLRMFNIAIIIGIGGILLKITNFI